MFRVILPSIIRTAYNCIYSLWYFSHHYCYLPLSWKSWNWFECVVGGVRHPQHTQTWHWTRKTSISASNNYVTKRFVLILDMQAHILKHNPDHLFNSRIDRRKGIHKLSYLVPFSLLKPKPVVLSKFAHQRYVNIQTTQTLIDSTLVTYCLYYYLCYSRAQAVTKTPPQGNQPTKSLRS
jgi:hypothetical protein